MISKKKLKRRLEIVSNLFFWPPVIYLGFLYGWKLPVLMSLIAIGVALQRRANNL